jgi:hypothetical protein
LISERCGTQTPRTTLLLEGVITRKAGAALQLVEVTDE